MPRYSRFDVPRTLDGWPEGYSSDDRAQLVTAVSLALKRRGPLDINDLYRELYDSRELYNLPKTYTTTIVFEWAYAALERALRKLKCDQVYRLPEWSNRVYVVEYEHKHGTDIHVCADYDAAARKVRTIVRDNRDEWRVPDCVSDEEALGNWFKLTGGNEAIRITDAPVTYD